MHPLTLLFLVIHTGVPIGAALYGLGLLLT